MSTYRLEYLLNPRSVAVIGASSREGSLGTIVLRQIMRSGYDGEIIPVNPKYRNVGGLPCLSHLSEGKAPVDLAVITAPPQSVPAIIDEAGRMQVKTAVVLTAGLGHGLGSFAEAMAKSARQSGLRIIGPNCLGVLAPCAKLNASFAIELPQPGPIALISQSGAVVSAMIAWAKSRHVGFSGIVSVGDMIDVDIGDCLDYFAADPQTHAITLYVEALREARKFMSAARAAARAKSVFVIKSGRHAAAAKAATTHTGALASNDTVYDAAFRRSGLVRVNNLDDLFAASAVVSGHYQLSGPRLAILGNGGGIGVLAVDELERLAGSLADISESTLQNLDAVMPAIWSRRNPIDIIGDASPSRYRAAMDALLADSQVDAILVTNCPTAAASSADTASAVLESVRQITHRKSSRKPVLATWLDRNPVTAGQFETEGIPCFQDASEAVHGFIHAIHHKNAQQRLMARPSIDEYPTINQSDARQWLKRAVAMNETWLDPVTTAKVLNTFHIRTLPIRIEPTPEQAATAAAGIISQSGSCALKILSQDIPHKSDIGGVILNLTQPHEVETAAREMLKRISLLKPQAKIEGFAVQGMLRHAEAPELIIGAATDPIFGPVILFGAGGTAVEVINDKAIGFPPMDKDMALDLIDRTRIAKLLKGYRHIKSVNLDWIANALIGISNLLATCPEVVSIDLNPVCIDTDGLIAVDARMAISRPQDIDDKQPERRLAIRPYPAHWTGQITIPDGRCFHYRAIRAEDEDLLASFLADTPLDDIRLRFLQSSPRIDHAFLARLTQLDYDRSMAFLAFDSVNGTLSGVVRAYGDPNHDRAEFAVLVRSSLKGLGLGTELVRLQASYAKNDGYQELYGHVLKENTLMTRLCQDLGFAIEPDAGISNQVIIKLRLPTWDKGI